jgi:phage recombination protein Bet
MAHELATPAEQIVPDQVALIKRTIAKGATDDELALFLNQCRRTGLDPFSRQIHLVKRWSADERREVMTIQVGIDGLRLVAERTGRYVPGREPTFAYDDKGRLVSATAYVRKLSGGLWHEVAATAFLAEYVQAKKDGTTTRFWSRMPHLMLAKCAESLALRRAFPMELSGVYSAEEVTAEDEQPEALPAPQPTAKLPAAPAVSHTPGGNDGGAFEADAIEADQGHKKLLARCHRELSARGKTWLAALRYFGIEPPDDWAEPAAGVEGERLVREMTWVPEEVCLKILDSMAPKGRPVGPRQTQHAIGPADGPKAD